MPRTTRPTATAILSRWPATPTGEVPIRVLFARDRAKSHDLSFVSHVACRLEESRRNESNRYHGLARTVYEAAFDAGAADRLPERFTNDEPVMVADFRLAADTVPADFFDDPPDLRELYLQWDRDSGSAWADPVPADTATDRAYARLKMLRRRNAVEVSAAIVRAEPMLYEPGERDGTAQVLLSFDARAGHTDFLDRAASYLNALDGGRFRDEGRTKAAAIAGDERFIRHRRRELPHEAVDGCWVYACDLIVHRPFLADGVIQESFVTCLVEPGRRGRIEMLPQEAKKSVPSPHPGD